MNRKLVRSLLAVASLAMLLGVHVKSEAAIITNTVTFSRITANASEDVASLITADIVGYDGNDLGDDVSKALFIIRLGTHDTLDPFITDVFFEDGVLGSIAGLHDADDSVAPFAGYVGFGLAGVDYSHPGNQTNLPGAEGANPDFVAGANFSADPDTPQPTVKAINEGEYLGVLFNLDSGKTYSDLITEMLAGKNRVGVHVQGIGSQSDSFVSDLPPDFGDDGAVPEPMSLAIWGSISALGAIGAYRRRKLVSKP